MIVERTTEFCPVPSSCYSSRMQVLSTTDSFYNFLWRQMLFNDWWQSFFWLNLLPFYAIYQNLGFFSLPPSPLSNNGTCRAAYRGTSFSWERDVCFFRICAPGVLCKQFRNCSVLVTCFCSPVSDFSKLFFSSDGWPVRNVCSLLQGKWLLHQSELLLVINSESS